MFFCFYFIPGHFYLPKNPEINYMKKNQEIKKAKLIYNPHSGEKRNKNPLHTKVTLEEIKSLLEQYQIQVDYFPTRYAKHATVLAENSVKEGYDLVIAAGGDGTVGEVINGLVGTDVIVGILPLGTVMNVARMLSVPLDIEKAVELIKIKRVRKIDLGCITKLNGEKMEKPYYFVEQAGLGIDAAMHYNFTRIFDKKEYLSLFKMINGLFAYYGHRSRVFLDDSSVETKATMVSVSNGPLAGPALKLAPNAKLNDHKLTVTIFDINRIKLTFHILRLLFRRKSEIKNIKSYHAEKVKVISDVPKMVHADARLFGETPVEFKIVPSAVNVITGFPKSENAALLKRTYLDP